MFGNRLGTRPCFRPATWPEDSQLDFLLVQNFTLIRDQFASFHCGQDLPGRDVPGVAWMYKRKPFSVVMCTYSLSTADRHRSSFLSSRPARKAARARSCLGLAVYLTARSAGVAGSSDSRFATPRGGS